MAGFISGFRAGRSDELQRQQLKSQDQALRYKMGIDAENRMFKYAKEARDQATFQNKNDKDIMRRALTRISLGEELDMTEDIAGAAKRTGYYSILAEEPNQLIADISVANTNLGKFVSGEYTAQEAWTPEVERVMNLAFADRLNLVEGQSRNGRPIVERKVMGVRPAINPETGEMRMEGNDPILNVMIAVKDQKGGDWLTNEDGSLSTFPLTELGTADDNDQLEPIRLSSVVDRINGIDQTAKFKKLNPEQAKTLMSALSGSGININTVESAKSVNKKAANERINTKITKLITDGDQARDNMSQLVNMNNLLTQANAQGAEGRFYGWFGERKLQFAQIGAGLGLKGEFFDPAVIANARAFFSESGKMALQFIQQTKGAISEKEMALFAAMSASLQLTDEGNRLILAMAMQAARAKEVMGQAAEEFNQKLLNGEVDVGDWAAYQKQVQDKNNLNMAADLATMNAAVSEHTKGGLRYVEINGVRELMFEVDGKLYMAEDANDVINVLNGRAKQAIL